MIQQLSLSQIKEIKIQKIADEQKNLAESGVSSALENGQVVTIGDSDRDYLDWKHFIVAQIARLGFSTYVAITGWDISELVEDLAEENGDNSVWQDDAIAYFNGVEGNY